MAWRFTHQWIGAATVETGHRRLFIIAMWPRARLHYFAIVIPMAAE
jgi:hypothetical protein